MTGRLTCLGLLTVAIACESKIVTDATSASGSDTTAPTVTLASSASSTTATSPIPITVTFSESVTGFVVGDMTVSGGTTQNFSGSGASYAFEVVPSQDGTITVSMAAGVAVDAASNGNIASSNLVRVYDAAVPTITSAETMDTDGDGYIDHYKINFSEDVDDSSVSGYVNTTTLGSVQTDLVVASRSNVRIDPTVGDDVDDDNVIYLAFDESSAFDTDVTPDLTAAAGAIDDLRGRAIAAVAAGTVAEDDAAAPRLVKARARKLDNRVRLYFSESVYTNSDGTGNLVEPDLTYTNNDTGTGDAAGLSSVVIDGDASDKVAVFRSSGLTLRGYFRHADLGTDQIGVKAASVYDGAGNAAVAHSVTIDAKQGADFNGDGLDDVVLGAPGYNGGGTDRGRTYIFYGGSIAASNEVADADVVITGLDDNKTFGRNYEAVGDVDGDGLDDLTVTTAGDSPVYLFLGKDLTASMDTSDYSAQMQIGAATNLISRGVGRIGDVNADGLDDLMWAATSSTGAAYLYYGSAGISGNLTVADADATFGGSLEVGAHFGAVFTGGDLNNDGYSDVVIAGPDLDTGAAMIDRGMVFVVYGGSGATLLSGTINLSLGGAVIIRGDANNAAIGMPRDGSKTLDASGDLNNDHIVDLVIGAPEYWNGTVSNVGAVFAFYGSTLTNEDVSGADVIMPAGGSTSTIINGYIGASVAVADLDQNGHDDLIFTSSQNVYSAEVYVFNGDTLAAASDLSDADFMIAGTQAVSNFGSHIEACGDLNQDGTPDLRMSANQFTVDLNGRSFVFTGGNITASEVDTNADYIFSGELTMDYLE